MAYFGPKRLQLIVIRSVSSAHTVGDGDDGAFYKAWTDTADRLMAEGVEHRLAACIADPAQACPADGFRAFAMKMGVDIKHAGNGTLHHGGKNRSDPLPYSRYPCAG